MSNQLDTPASVQWKIFWLLTFFVISFWIISQQIIDRYFELVIHPIWSYTTEIFSFIFNNFRIVFAKLFPSDPITQLVLKIIYWSLFWKTFFIPFSPSNLLLPYIFIGLGSSSILYGLLDSPSKTKSVLICRSLPPVIFNASAISVGASLFIRSALSSSSSARSTAV